MLPEIIVHRADNVRESAPIIKAPKKRNQTEEPTNRLKRNEMRQNSQDQRANNVSQERRNMIRENIDKVVYDNQQAVKIKQQIQEREVRSKEMNKHGSYGKVPGYIKKFNKQRDNMVIARMMEEE